jgi:hypothetical protein
MKTIFGRGLAGDGVPDIPAQEEQVILILY